MTNPRSKLIYSYIEVEGVFLLKQENEQYGGFDIA